MLWHWRNDPKRLPDDDHSRCIAAPGVRELVYRGRLFEMTTVACPRGPASGAAPAAAGRAILQIEHVGDTAPHALFARYWRSGPFDSGSPGGVAQHGAGLELLAAVATELAAA
jgi:hypothetical protein